MRAPFAAIHIFLDDDELFIEGTGSLEALFALRLMRGPSPKRRLRLVLADV